MKNFSFTILFILLCPSFSSYCQPDLEEEFLEHSGEVLNETEDPELAGEEIEEFLKILGERININEVDEETLQKLPFITGFQIFSFLSYREKYGKIYSKNELWLIPGFHEELVKKFSILFEFITNSKKEHNNEFSNPHLRQRLLIRFKIENPKREGFKVLKETDHFHGSRLYRLGKYEMEKKGRFRLGFSLENDAGEAFSFDSLSSGFDFSSGYAEYAPAWFPGTFITGDFRISSAEGLIYSKGRNGKSSLNAFRRSLPMLSKYSSTSEYGFYRGAAVHLKIKKIRSILFYSANRNDAKTYSDTLKNNYFLSPANSGYHRNNKEKMIRDKIREQAAGLVLSYTNDHFQAGYNIKYLHYMPEMGYNKRREPYSGIILENEFAWQSVFYNFQTKKILLSAELAKMHGGGFSLQQKASISLHPLYTLNLGYRNFSPEYFCPGAGGLSESASPGNEKGFFSEILCYPFRFLKIRLYLDQYFFPWISYRNSFPSAGTDLLIDTEWYMLKDLALRIYFKTENKEFDSSSSGQAMKKILTGRTSRFYTRITYSLNQNLSFRFRFELKVREEPAERPVYGILFYEELSGKYFNNRLSFNFRYTLFDIPDWEVRIYSWEHDLLYSLSSPSYYKNGQNVFLNLRWKINRNFSSGMKLSATAYSSVRESGTGPDYRESLLFFDLKGQLIIKL